MQFIRLPKPIDIAERVLPELVSDWVDTWSVQGINIIVFQQLRVNILASWVIEWSESWMPHRRTFGTFTHWAWAIWDLSNHDLIWVIPGPGSQMSITSSLESTWTIPVQARASDDKMPKMGQRSSKRGMPCFVNVFRTICGTWDQPDRNPGAPFRYLADIFSIITNCEMQQPGMLIVRKIGQVSFVGCTHDSHNRRSGRKLILYIPPPITHDHLAVDSMTLWVSEVHRFKFEVCLKWEMC